MTNSTRNLGCVRPTKVPKSEARLHILLYAVNPVVQRYSSLGPLSLLPILNTTLLQHQIELLLDVFSNSEITVLVGNHADKLIKILPDYVRCIENQLFECTNEIESARLYFNNISLQECLIINGNLLFNESHLNQLDTNQSQVLVSKELSKEEISITACDNRITVFTFGRPLKWGHITFLRGKELNYFDKFCKQRKNNQLFLFEALNNVINRGGKISYTEVTSLYKLDDYYTYKNYENINK